MILTLQSFSFTVFHGTAQKAELSCSSVGSNQKAISNTKTGQLQRAKLGLHANIAQLL